jgi:hypothetical protein
MFAFLAPLALAAAPAEPASEPEPLLGAPTERPPKIYVIRSSHIPADLAYVPAPPVTVVVDAHDRDRRGHHRRDRRDRGDRDDRGGGGRFDDGPRTDSASDDDR